MQAGRVCYYYSLPGTVYEQLGHAEAVQLKLNPDKAAEEFRTFSKTCAWLVKLGSCQSLRMPLNTNAKV